MVPWLSPKFLIGAGHRGLRLGRRSRSFSTSASWRRGLPGYGEDLDPARTSRPRRRYTDASYRDEDGALWLDYASDVGEGFDPTYTVAWLLGRETLELAAEASGI